MADNPTSAESLGLEIDSKSIKGAELKLLKGIPQLLNVFEVMINQESSTPTNVKLLYTEDEKANLTNLLDNNLVVTALSTSHILARQLELNLTKDKDIDSVLEFQAEPLIPYPLEEGFIDKIVLSRQSDSTTLTIIAAQKHFISDHLDQCKSMHIEPEIVTCTPIALASFSKLFSPVDTPHILLHLGINCITGAVVENGKLIATQSTGKGIEQLDAPSEEERSKALETLNFDITRLIFALTKQMSGSTPTGLILTGEGIENQNLINLITENSELKTLKIREESTFPIPEVKLQKYAVSIGSALTALDDSFDQINFRQGDYSYPFPWKRIQKPLFTYLGLSVLLAATFYIFGSTYLTHQQDQIRESYVNLLAYMKKPYSEFEGKFSGKEYTPEDQLSVFDLSKTDISHRLNLLEKEIRATPDLFPLLPNTPRVSDVLAWLATHPHITGSDDPGPTGEPRIQLTSFSYKMVKRPEENKKRVKYQVKVEIEFTTPLPKYAREFHDILLSPNKIVDPKSDVKWGTERGKYRASFFLKDKTLYPQ